MQYDGYNYRVARYMTDIENFKLIFLLAENGAVLVVASRCFVEVRETFSLFHKRTESRDRFSMSESE